MIAFYFVKFRKSANLFEIDIALKKSIFFNLFYLKEAFPYFCMTEMRNEN